MKKLFTLLFILLSFLFLNCAQKNGEFIYDNPLDPNGINWQPLGMVLIGGSGDSFQMGSDNISSWAKPVHTVQFTYNFWMDTIEVTQEDYESLMGKNPSIFSGTDLPVENVTWFDAVLYCNKRSQNVGFDTVYSYTSVSGIPGDSCVLNGLSIDLTKNGYRLPTEAEWEFACRGGIVTEWYWGNDSSRAGNFAWYKENSGNTTHPVGTKVSNARGLYDMSGNVFEWCNDWYADYSSGTQTDPTGPASGSDRIMRSGSFYSDALGICSAYRLWDKPWTRYSNVGFRVVLPQSDN